MSDNIAGYGCYMLMRNLGLPKPAIHISLLPSMLNFRLLIAPKPWLCSTEYSYLFSSSPRNFGLPKGISHHLKQKIIALFAPNSTEFPRSKKPNYKLNINSC